MTDTTVAYHVEDGVGRPAIHVRDWHAGMDYTIALQRAVGPSLADELRDRSEHERGPFAVAYDRIVSDFWQAAQEIATQRGLGEIAQEGRSGGWLVFTDGKPDPIEDVLGDGERIEAEWLAAYRAMVEWADAWIADAPRKVAALAQQYAMDKAGEDAALRFFACDPGFPHRYMASVARGNAIMAGYEEGATA